MVVDLWDCVFQVVVHQDEPLIGQMNRWVIPICDQLLYAVSTPTSCCRIEPQDDREHTLYRAAIWNPTLEAPKLAPYLGFTPL